MWDVKNDEHILNLRCCPKASTSGISRFPGILLIDFAQKKEDWIAQFHKNRDILT